MSVYEHGDRYSQLKKKKFSNQILLDFSANINPLGYSRSVKKTLLSNIESIVHYPAPQDGELQRAIKEYYNLPSHAGILTTNGAAEAFYTLCQYLRPHRALFLAPCFSEYERAVRSVGGECAYFVLSAKDDFQPDTEKLASRLTGCDIVFIANPNNPTGGLWPQKALEYFIAQAAAQKCFVVLDESFLDFRADYEDFSAQYLLGTYDNFCIVHSMTKFFALPGLRLGFVVGTQKLVQKLSYFQQPWNVSTLAQLAGIAALGDIEYGEETRSYVHTERVYLQQELAKFSSWHVYEPTVNFLLLELRVESGLTAFSIQENLLKRGILIRNCDNYRGLDSRYFRLAVRRREENRILVQTLRNLKLK